MVRKMPAKKRVHGFTLIELLVVFSVIATLSSVGIVSLLTYSRSQEVNQSASDIKLLINQARSNALSAVKSERNEQGATIDCGVATLSGYSIERFTDTALDFNLECTGSAPARIKRLTLPNNLSFGTGTTCINIFFNSLTTTAAGVPCEIILEGYEQEKTITVDAIGNVSIE